MLVVSDSEGAAWKDTPVTGRARRGRPLPCLGGGGVNGDILASSTRIAGIESRRLPFPPPVGYSPVIDVNPLGPVRRSKGE